MLSKQVISKSSEDILLKILEIYSGKVSENIKIKDLGDLIYKLDNKLEESPIDGLRLFNTNRDIKNPFLSYIFIQILQNLEFFGKIKMESNIINVTPLGKLESVLIELPSHVSEYLEEIF